MGARMIFAALLSALCCEWAHAQTRIVSNDLQIAGLDPGIKLFMREKLWNAANIYAPTLVIGGDFDTWSFQEDRQGLMNALVHAPVKHNVVIHDARHFVLFEKNRQQFFEEVLKFIKE